MPEAARATDPISHTMALAGLIAGALLGVLVGIAIVASGGAALGALALAACTGASLGGGLGQFLGSFFSTPAGVLATGSVKVFIGNLPAARAIVDTALCTQHSGPPAPIAQGSSTVTIEYMPAARVGDKGTCGFTISGGCSTVIIGEDGSTTYLEISQEVPAWLQWTLLGLGLIGPGGLLRLGGMAWARIGWVLGLSVAGGFGGGYFGHILGGHFFGENSTGQKLTSFGMSVFGSILGMRLGMPPRLAPNVNQSSALKQSTLRVGQALEEAGVSRSKVKAYGVATHQDGTVTVALSGSAKSVNSAWKRMKLPENYKPAPLEAAREGFTTPNSVDPITGKAYAGSSSTCVEPRLAEGIRNNSSPMSEATSNPVWRSSKPNPYPTEGNPGLMEPCPSCETNAPLMPELFPPSPNASNSVGAVPGIVAGSTETTDGE